LFCTFDNNPSLTSVEALKDWNVENVESVHSLFGFCPNLVDVECLENWNLSESVNKDDMFNL